MLRRVPGWLKTAHGSFIVLAVVFGVYFVFSTPLLWGSDETSHTGRVYQITHGQILSGKIYDKTSYSHEGYGGVIPANLRKVVDYVNIDFNANSDQKIPGIKTVDNAADYRTFSKLPMSGSRVNYNFSNTAIYSPVSYVPAVIGLGLAQVLHLYIGPTIYMTRLFDLTFYVAAIAFLLYALRNLRLKWVIFAVALLPSALFQAATINADMMTNVLAFIVVGLVMKAILSKNSLSKPELAVLIISTLCLPVVKPSYLFLSVLALLVPGRMIPFASLGRYKKWLMPAALVLGIIIYGLWQYKTNYLTNAVKYIIAGVVPWWQDIDSAGQIHYVLTHPFAFLATLVRSMVINDSLYFNGLFGRIGFSFMQVPAVAIIGSFLAMALSVLGSERMLTVRRNLLVIAAVAVLTVLAVFGVCYLTISAVGMATIEGVQGRYFVPILPVLLFGIAYVTKTRIDITKLIAYRRVAVTIVCLVAVSLLATAVKYQYVIWG